MYLYKFRLANFWRKLASPFTNAAIIREVVTAHLNKLPDGIFVEWFREDGYIIGKVKADDKEFITQGKNAVDFIRMVNESVVAAFNIPAEYSEAVLQSYSFPPTPEALRELNDSSVQSASFGFSAPAKKALQPA